MKILHVWIYSVVLGTGTDKRKRQYRMMAGNFSEGPKVELYTDKLSSFAEELVERRRRLSNLPGAIDKIVIHFQPLWNFEMPPEFSVFGKNGDPYRLYPLTKKEIREFFVALRKI